MATCDGKLPQAIFLTLGPGWPPIHALPIAYTNTNVAIEGYYGRDVATQAASGLQPCVPRAPSQRQSHSHSSILSSESHP